MPQALSTRRPATGGVAAALHRHWYPLVALVRRDLKKRYARSMLGAAWAILQPLLYVTVYVLAFSLILRVGRQGAGGRGYVFYMLAGMLPFQAIADAVYHSINALREDRALLDREAFPAAVIPAARVVTASLSEAIGLVLLAILGPLFGMPAGGWVFVLPFLLALRVLMTCGLAWALSVLAVFVADLSEAVSLILTAWMFATPIFYSLDAAPRLLQRAMWLNPLYDVASAYRRVLMGGRAPWPDAAIVLLWSVLLAAGGLWFFRKTLERAKDLL